MGGSGVYNRDDRKRVLHSVPHLETLNTTIEGKISPIVLPLARLVEAQFPPFFSLVACRGT